MVLTGATERMSKGRATRSEFLPSDDEAEVDAREGRQNGVAVKVASGMSRPSRMVSVRNSIFGRPRRPYPDHHAGDCYTLKREEPVNLAGQRLTARKPPDFSKQFLPAKARRESFVRSRLSQSGPS